MEITSALHPGAPSAKFAPGRYLKPSSLKLQIKKQYNHTFSKDKKYYFKGLLDKIAISVQIKEKSREKWNMGFAMRSSVAAKSRFLSIAATKRLRKAIAGAEQPLRITIAQEAASGCFEVDQVMIPRERR